jgi:hypothetical protein
MIEQSVKPTDRQRLYLGGLQNAAAEAANILRASCQRQQRMG